VKKNKRKSRETTHKKRDNVKKDEEHYEIVEEADRGVNKLLPEKLKLIFPTV